MIERPMKKSATPEANTADTTPPKRAWQRMLSGRRLDLLDPDPADIAIEDIAHGLARVARWNGQTLGPHAFSVAQHSLLVDEISGSRNPNWPAQWRLAALLHDAPEYVIGDLISPFKNAIGLDYKQLEQRLLAAIHTRFKLPSELPDAIRIETKNCDRIAAFYEATRLAGFGRDEALTFFGEPSGLSEESREMLENLQPMSADEAQSAFLARFAWLTERL
jgi:5'-deoxynucleotidase YfbR-like HD superfamily hydrolase